MLRPQSSAACWGMANAGSRPRSRASEEAASAPSRWAWNTSFLGSLKAVLRKELVGPMSDGLRVNWHITEGTFVGPGHDAVVLPGAANWMHIRRMELRSSTSGRVSNAGPCSRVRRLRRGRRFWSRRLRSALRGEYDRQIPAVDHRRMRLRIRGSKAQPRPVHRRGQSGHDHTPR